jgi:hypothetical protein
MAAPQENQRKKPCRIPMGKKMAPANKKPQRPSAKHVKMCVNHAATQDRPMAVSQKVDESDIKLFFLGLWFTYYT